MQIQNIKNYFLYYLKDNLLIFDVSKYIDDLAIHVIDFVYEWGLMENNLVNCSQKLIKELIETKIKNDINYLFLISKENNCKILSFIFYYNENPNWINYFSDSKKFIKICKTKCKKLLPNFKEKKTDKKYFLKTKGNFHGIPCLIPSGDDEEFLNINIDKLKSANKYL